MRVGDELLDLALATGAGTIFVVGTGRNVGKTTALRAAYEAAWRRGLRAGVASIGRDSEGSELAPSQQKPRILLHSGTVFATARASLPRSPASEILKLSRLHGAAGPLLYARAISDAVYELVGPPTASGVREIVGELRSYCELTIVDGAVDRVAALAGMGGAIVVACGAAAGGTLQEAVDDVAGLVARLRVRAHDPNAAAIHVEGALTASQVAAFVAARETREIVVGDPTQIALSGKAATLALARLNLRCLRPLRPIAATVASIGPQRSFEPRAFARAVAAATGLPALDVYAGTRTA